MIYFPSKTLDSELAFAASTLGFSKELESFRAKVFFGFTTVFWSVEIKESEFKISTAASFLHENRSNGMRNNNFFILFKRLIINDFGEEWLILFSS